MTYGIPYLSTEIEIEPRKGPRRSRKQNKKNFRPINVDDDFHLLSIYKICTNSTTGAEGMCLTVIVRELWVSVFLYSIIQPTVYRILSWMTDLFVGIRTQTGPYFSVTTWRFPVLHENCLHCRSQDSIQDRTRFLIRQVRLLTPKLI